MASNIPADASSQHLSIVYCPSCGASASLLAVPPSNAGLFCDICTSPNLLVSTNDGADWNPLSDAFNALSLSSNQHDGDNESSAAAATAPQIIHHPVEDLEIKSPTPTIQDEMKRRSLILSELMNYREALYQQHGNEDVPTTNVENNMEVPTDHFSHIAHTYNNLLHLRQQSGMFLMDEVDTMNDDGVYMHNNLYHNGAYPQEAEEEGMYDDPPQEYVNAHPPVQEAGQGWYGATPSEGQVRKEEPGVHPQPIDNSPFAEEDEDEDDDEGQVYATPEQRDEMKRRRSELHQDKELRAREMFWRKYGIGGLGTGH
ncbi:hypothetical protein TWF281_000176 [Arthrobotrys megalospora]